MIDLQRFHDAQSFDYSQALKELIQGKKRSHWIWFIFPQVDGLGGSAVSERFAIKSADEAIAYLNDQILSTRLNECCEALLTHANQPIKSIMGFPDDLKLKSSMTLFSGLAPEGSVYQTILDVFYGSERCAHTARFLSGSAL